jgi:hypothetical protein
MNWRRLIVDPEARTRNGSNLRRRSGGGGLGHVRLGSKADLQDILNVFVATGVMVADKALKWVTRSPQGQSFPLRARSLLARALASSSAR